MRVEEETRFTRIIGLAEEIGILLSRLNILNTEEDGVKEGIDIFYVSILRTKQGDLRADNQKRRDPNSQEELEYISLRRRA